jgi:hypothetical protein
MTFNSDHDAVPVSSFLTCSVGPISSSTKGAGLYQNYPPPLSLATTCRALNAMSCAPPLGLFS